MSPVVGAAAPCAVVALMVLAFGSKRIVQHAHEQHQGVLVFLQHSLAGWLV